ncbi:hypothetical protein F2P56_015578 [Juglans regia]|uniref:Uncharacterized protein n=1 Tax=Juglans regia TaxID=51240 RepID=A0A834CV66_JUGRE|nr:hypothetical protein F2P56_015578 [Juglans regia]
MRADHHASLITSSENVPRMGADFGRHNRGFSIAKIAREALFQIYNFFLEAGVGKGLCHGKDKTTPSVAAGAKSEAKVASFVKQWTDGFEELGGPTGLDDDLCGVDEEAGL